MTTITLGISGMICDHCATTAQSALNQIPGVSARVSFEDSAAEINTKADVPVKHLLDALDIQRPITVRKAMERVDGVHSVTVDYDAKTAVAVFDPAQTSAKSIADASTDVGYPAAPIID